MNLFNTVSQTIIGIPNDMSESKIRSLTAVASEVNKGNY